MVIEDGTETLHLDYNYNTNSTTNIGEGLFYDCPLETLYLGRNLEYKTAVSYGYSPFYSIESLAEVTIGNSVTSLGTNLFRSCSSLEKLIIEDGIDALVLNYGGMYGSMFYDCPIKTLYLGRNLLNAEQLPNTLTDVTIGNSVTSIGDRAFEDCSGLMSITLGSSVAEIGSEVFDGCDKLMTIYSLNPTPPTGGSNSFTNQQYIDANVYVPKGSLAAYQAADPWQNFWNIQDTIDTPTYDFMVDGLYYSIVSESDLTCAVTYCAADDSEYSGDIVIPDSVTYDGQTWKVVKIGNFAFLGCDGLTSVTLGSYVAEIGESAFKGCDNLMTIYSLNPTPPTVGDDNFTEQQYEDVMVYVAQGSLTNYKNADVWRNFLNIQEIAPTGIDNVSVDNEPFVTIEGGVIKINKQGSQPVSVYTVDGQCVYTGTDNTISNLAKGLYIIRSGCNISKILIK